MQTQKKIALLLEVQKKMRVLPRQLSNTAIYWMKSLCCIEEYPLFFCKKKWGYSPDCCLTLPSIGWNHCCIEEYPHFFCKSEEYPYFFCKLEEYPHFFLQILGVALSFFAIQGGGQFFWHSANLPNFYKLNRSGLGRILYGLVYIDMTNEGVIHQHSPPMLSYFRWKKQAMTVCQTLHNLSVSCCVMVRADCFDWSWIAQIRE